VISGIEVQNFKGFRHLKLSELGPFHVLAGPNGSGKSSFFEILEFVKDLLLFDVREAVSRRQVSSLRDLTFDRLGGSISFDIALDEGLFQRKPTRYQLTIAESTDSGVIIVSEVLLVSSNKLVWRTGDSPVYYAREDGLGEDYFSFPWARSALSQVPPDERRYPTANRVKNLLVGGVQMLELNGGRMGMPCAPSVSAEELLPNGNNLARVVGRLLRGRADEWIDHLRLALEDLESISWRQREDDRAEYLVLHYRDGLEIPSWLASFGTLRTLALTLPAFLLADEPRLCLFEEPEDGIHPKAIEIVMDAIRSIPNAQTFVTTHSPMIVQQSGIGSLLLFSKRDKEVVVQHGEDNSILRNLDGVPDLATVFASRVLG
jgi:predicted ATPase